MIFKETKILKNTICLNRSSHSITSQGRNTCMTSYDTVFGNDKSYSASRVGFVDSPQKRDKNSKQVYISSWTAHHEFHLGGLDFRGARSGSDEKRKYQSRTGMGAESGSTKRVWFSPQNLRLIHPYIDQGGILFF